MRGRSTASAAVLLVYTSIIGVNYLTRHVNNLISTNMQTHNALHFGSPDYYPERFDLRTPGDTIPWKTKKGGPNYGL